MHLYQLVSILFSQNTVTFSKIREIISQLFLGASSWFLWPKWSKYPQTYIHLQKLIIPAQKIHSGGGTRTWTGFYMKTNLDTSLIDVNSYLKISLWIQSQRILVFSVLSLQGKENKLAMPCKEASPADLQELLFLQCNLMLNCPKQPNSMFATVLQGGETSWSILLIPELTPLVRSSASLAFSPVIILQF